jgi:hypothetical protein
MEREVPLIEGRIGTTALKEGERLGKCTVAFERESLTEE